MSKLNDLMKAAYVSNFFADDNIGSLGYLMNTKDGIITVTQVERVSKTEVKGKLIGTFADTPQEANRLKILYPVSIRTVSISSRMSELRNYPNV